ncbi:MAG: hypothetical protein K2W96_23560 [Gemmataceae bacterium]|nr:hypothetical protein [Gemmataceae bacterium]
MFDDFDLIHKYTRAEALADGTLVDVTPLAREAGLKWPVAVTRQVFERYVRVPEGVVGQDVAGRTWDIVFMLRWAISRSLGGDTLLYEVYVRNDEEEPQSVQLKAVAGPDDDGSPCITVMLPLED